MEISSQLLLSFLPKFWTEAFAVDQCMVRAHNAAITSPGSQLSVCPASSAQDCRQEKNLAPRATRLGLLHSGLLHPVLCTSRSVAEAAS